MHNPTKLPTCTQLDTKPSRITLAGQGIAISALLMCAFQLGKSLHETDADRYTKLFADNPHVRGTCDITHDGHVTLHDYVGQRNGRPVLRKVFETTTSPSSPVFSVETGKNLSPSFRVSIHYKLATDFRLEPTFGNCHLIDSRLSHADKNPEIYLGNSPEFIKAFGTNNPLPPPPPHLYLLPENTP